jgi:hypothetical protein
MWTNLIYILFKQQQISDFSFFQTKLSYKLIFSSLRFSRKNDHAIWHEHKVHFEDKYEYEKKVLIMRIYDKLFYALNKRKIK